MKVTLAPWSRDNMRKAARFRTIVISSTETHEKVESVLGITYQFCFRPTGYRRG